MKSFYFTLFTLALAGIACATESLVKGGRSKDGKYEVRLVVDAQNSSPYSFVIYDTRSNKQLSRLDDVGGYDSYEQAQNISEALWSKSGHFVSIMDHSSRHGTTIYIMNVSDRSSHALNIQDYIQNALGRVDATETDGKCYSRPTHWEKENLHIILDFGIKIPSGRAIYECEAVLECQEGDSIARLTKVSKPEIVISSEP